MKNRLGSGKPEIVLALDPKTSGLSEASKDALKSLNPLFGPEGLPAHHRLKAVGSSARLKAPEARHERFIL